MHVQLDDTREGGREGWREEEGREEEGREITCLNIRDADVHGARVCGRGRKNERAKKEP